MPSTRSTLREFTWMNLHYPGLCPAIWMVKEISTHIDR